MVLSGKRKGQVVFQLFEMKEEYIYIYIYLFISIYYIYYLVSPPPFIFLLPLFIQRFLTKKLWNLLL